MKHIINLAAASIGAALLAAVVAAGPAGALQSTAAAQTTLVAAVPDLVIDSAKSLHSDDSKLKVRVRNAGAVGAGPNNMKLFYHRSGHVVVRGAVVPALAPGAQTWVVIDADSPIDNAEHVYLRVDDPNRVAELNEGNNSFIYK